MSSESFSTENPNNTSAAKLTWHVQLKTSAQAYNMILDEARRDERSIAYIVSKIMEAYYDEKTKLKIV